jgi:signal transduction histidine kinase
LTKSSLNSLLCKNIGRWSFQQQLSLVFSASVLIFALIGSISVSWLDWQRSYDVMLAQGKQVSESFAQESTLALLYEMGSNADRAATTTLNFPDIAYVSISDTSGKIILERWKSPQDEGDSYSHFQFNKHDHFDDGDYIHLSSKVYSQNEENVDDSPFDSFQEPVQHLGNVHIAIDKSNFESRIYSTFLTNIGIFIAFSLITLAILLFVGRRLSSPLNELSQIMKGVQAGNIAKTVNISGSHEIDNMVSAYNSMIEVLDERARNLDSKNKMLSVEIEERKLAEDERKKLQTQLLQAQKMEAVGQLTGGIAHDFNNILAAMLGYAQLAHTLSEKEEHEKLCKYLSEILKSGERARDLIAKMLAYSRKSGSVSTQISKISIHGMIDEALSMLASLIPSSIHIDTDIDDDIPNIALDGTQFQQLLINLCINARDAMNGKGNLRIGAKHFNGSIVCDSCHKPHHGSYIELYVEDDGGGIPDDIKTKLFEPFFTTKEVGQGTGMGLAMVHGILHSHQGHLVVESKVGVGTKFRMMFPLRITDHADAMTAIDGIATTHESA